MKNTIKILLVAILLFPALAYGEEEMSFSAAMQPQMMVFEEKDVIAEVIQPQPPSETPEIALFQTVSQQDRLFQYSEKWRGKWNRLVGKTISFLNLRLAGNGKGLLLNQQGSAVLKGSTKRIQIIWAQSSQKELTLRVTKSGEATLGYTIEF